MTDLQDTIYNILVEDEGIDLNALFAPDPDIINQGDIIHMLKSAPVVLTAVLNSPRLLEMLAAALTPHISAPNNTEE